MDCISELIAKVGFAISDKSAPTVLIDISCCKKSDLSALLVGIANSDSAGEITIDFVYSHAKYSMPVFDERIGSNPEPIISELSGLDIDYERPSSIILGLGYEPYVALSFIEVIDPSRIWTFSPNGHDSRYEDAVSGSNDKLFAVLKSIRHAKLSYPYNDIYGTFERLESCVAGALQNNRITIAPYGMKTFFLCSVLVAIIRMPMVAVWHLKDEPEGYKINREPDGNLSFLRTVWS